MWEVYEEVYQVCEGGIETVCEDCEIYEVCEAYTCVKCVK